LLLVVGQQAATQWLLARGDALSLLVEALLEPKQLLLLTVGMGGVAILVSLGTYWAFCISFYEGWNRFRDVPARKPLTTSYRGRATWLARWIRILPLPLRGFLIKEWLEFVRDPRGLVSLAQPLILVLVVLAPLLSSKEAFSVLQPLVFWFVLVLLVLFLTTLPIGSSMIAVAREGKSIALLRSMPVSMSDVLKGKFWASWLPVTAWWTVAMSVAGLLLRWPGWQVGVVAAVIIWASAGTSAAATAMGGLTVDFAREELKQRIPMRISYLQMALNLVFALLSIGSSLWLIVRLFPEDPTVLVLQALSRFQFVGWLYASSPWIPLLLAGAQAAFLIGVVMLWRAAVRRLEHWELAGS
jgi:hypothetical protein